MRRARLEPQRLGQPGRVGPPPVALGAVAVADLLGEVFGQVADAPGCVLGRGEHALGVESGAEPGHVVRLVAELIQRLIPAGQDLIGFVLFVIFVVVSSLILLTRQTRSPTPRVESS